MDSVIPVAREFQPAVLRNPWHGCRKIAAKMGATALFAFTRRLRDKEA